MLVLTRTIGEKVVIGADVSVTVVAIERCRVRLAFDAPDDVPINREEIQERIDAEKALANGRAPQR